jgi:hypothetical protein
VEGKTMKTATRKPNPAYCSQNNGDCTTCSLVSYNRDCHNNSVARVADGRCQCGRPVIYCDIHGANHAESYAARLEHCRQTDTTPSPTTGVVGEFFGRDLKITRAGYIYINGKKLSDQKLTPINIPPSIPDWAFPACQNWLKNNFKMI